MNATLEHEGAAGREDRLGVELEAEGATVIRLGRHGYLSDVRGRTRETTHPLREVRASKRVIARHRNLRT